MIKLYYFKDNDPNKYVNSPHHKYVYLCSDDFTQYSQAIVTNKQTDQDREDYFLEVKTGTIISG